MEGDRIDGQAAFMDGFGNRMVPADIRLADAAAETTKTNTTLCGDPLAGCEAYVTATDSALQQFQAYFADVKRGYAAYGSVAKDSAADYRQRDEVGRDEVERALNIGMLRKRDEVPPREDIPLIALQGSEVPPPDAGGPGDILQQGGTG